jgi:hypothetical protein
VVSGALAVGQDIGGSVTALGASGATAHGTRGSAAACSSGACGARCLQRLVSGCQRDTRTAGTHARLGSGSARPSGVHLETTAACALKVASRQTVLLLCALPRGHVPPLCKPSASCVWPCMSSCTGPCGHPFPDARYPPVVAQRARTVRMRSSWCTPLRDAIAIGRAMPSGAPALKPLAMRPPARMPDFIIICDIVGW